EAMALFQQAYQNQMQGDLEEAIELYKRSIDIFPTAEGHTFLGWTYSFQGRWDEAIEECLRAIEVDPTFGNPYNDIGAYLVEKGLPGETAASRRLAGDPAAASDAQLEKGPKRRAPKRRKGRGFQGQTGMPVLQRTRWSSGQ